MDISSMICSKTVRVGALGLCAGSMMLLGGCGIGSVATGGGGGTASPLVMTGNVHGGQQPISHSIVTLYLSGNSGYGSTSAAVAHTSTDTGSGNFAFVKSTSGSSNNTDNTWHCPTDGTDPLTYLIARGGNPNGTSDTTADNGAIALTTVLGRCSQVSNSTFAVVNELTTAAAATAFGQYFNPALEYLGSNGSIMLSGTSAQGAVGLTNAFASYNNLVNPSSGQAITANTYAGTGSASGVTVTATPEVTKLTTIANILAACVNSTATGGTSGTCAQLYAAATPPQYPAQTSMPSATYNTATDTLQAALYMATNPANLGTFTPCGGTATTNAQCLFALVSSFPAFAGSATVAPQDWTVGITYTASGTCSDGGAFFNGVAKEAIDGSGNIWVISGSSSANTNLAAITPAGQPFFCYGATGTVNGRGLTIDPSGNVWASFNTSGLGLLEFTPGSTTPVSWTTPATPYSVVSDPWGNIFFSQISSGGTMYEAVSPGAGTTGSVSSSTWTKVGANLTNVSGSVSLLTTAADNQGRVWTTNITGGATTILSGIAPAPIAINQLAVTGNVGTFGTPNGNTLQTGNNIAFYGLTSTAGKTLNYTVGTVLVASSTSFTAVLSSPDVASTAETGYAFQTGGGYTVATYNAGTAPIYGLAVDTQGSVFTGGSCCSSGPPYRVFDKITYASGAFSKSASEQFLAGINGSRSVTLDGASNVWAGYELPNDSTNTIYSIGEFFTTGTGTSATFTSLSPNGSTANLAAGNCATSSCTTGGGYYKTGLTEPFDIQVDPSGSVWALNSSTALTVVSTSFTGSSITQIVGAAVPVITPVAAAQRSTSLTMMP